MVKRPHRLDNLRAFLKNTDADLVARLLKTMTYREREIIKLRCGMGDGYIYTLEETGRIFKVTRERIRQIESKALEKFARFLPTNIGGA